MIPIDIGDEFRHEMRRLRDADAITIQFSILDAWCLLLAIQYARALGFDGPPGARAERIARAFQPLIGSSPALAQLAELGWPTDEQP
jgi:hypothetical protein